MAERTAATMTTSLSFFVRSAALPEGNVDAITTRSCEKLRYSVWLNGWSFRFKRKWNGSDPVSGGGCGLVREACDNGMIIRSETVL